MSLPIATPTSVCATVECAAFYTISKPTPSDKRKCLARITFAKRCMSLLNPFHGRTGFFFLVWRVRVAKVTVPAVPKKGGILIVLAYLKKGAGTNYLMTFDDLVWPNGSKMTVIHTHTHTHTRTYIQAPMQTGTHACIFFILQYMTKAPLIFK